MLKIIATSLVALVPLLGCSPSKAAKLTPAHEAVLSHFKSGKEPTAKDAIWATPYSFKVGVIDNKSNRDGYAQYVCKVIGDHIKDTSLITVRVIDIAALKRSKEWRTIGEHQCSKGGK